jgi:hypothetical protein
VELKARPITGKLAGKKWVAVLSGSTKGVDLSVEDTQ